MLEFIKSKILNPTHEFHILKNWKIENKSIEPGISEYGMYVLRIMDSKCTSASGIV
jgi:hypothetical protein